MVKRGGAARGQAQQRPAWTPSDPLGRHLGHTRHPRPLAHPLGPLLHEAWGRLVGGLTRVEERGSRPQPLHIHNGVQDQKDEEGEGAQRGDIGDGPGGQRASQGSREHIQHQPDRM